MLRKNPSAAPLSDLLSQLELAPPQAHAALTLWPLVPKPEAPPPAGVEYVALHTALAQGTLAIDEVGDGGVVGNVRVTNRGTAAVLFLFGEEIRGAKQNRVANASFLVAGKNDLVVDVSCVEAGRWGRSGNRGFESEREMVSQLMRRRMSRDVARSRAAGRGFRAQQGEVWNEIQDRLDVACAASPTQDYGDYRASRASELDALAAAFRAVPGQVGFVAAIDGEIAGLEAIGRPEVFADDFRALLRGYAIDALDAAHLRRRKTWARPRPRFREPGPFLAALAEVDCERRLSLGLGDDLRFESEAVEGCALACEGVVHVMAFPA
jgi:hypothetical protein